DASQSPDVLEMENIVYSDNENVGAEADFNNLESSITFKEGDATFDGMENHFEDFSEDISNDVSAASPIVPAA
nr:hypothetical protein [Tanacetum cinerariifolium]